MVAVTFKLRAEPTFRAVVDIPAAGGQVLQLDAEFRHFTRAQLLTFSDPEAVAKRSDVETLLAIMSGWHNVDEPFGADALLLLTENHASAAGAILTKWMRELTAQRLGN